jgi:hypothetical protein
VTWNLAQQSVENQQLHTADLNTGCIEKKLSVDAKTIQAELRLVLKEKLVNIDLVLKGLFIQVRTAEVH